MIDDKLWKLAEELTNDKLQDIKCQHDDAKRNGINVILYLTPAHEDFLNALHYAALIGQGMGGNIAEFLDDASMAFSYVEEHVTND